jgi:hypothetical protein
MKMSRYSDAKKIAESIAQMIVDELSDKPFAGIEEEEFRARFAGSKYEGDEEFMSDVANRLPISLKRKSVRYWHYYGSKFNIMCLKCRGYR